MVTRGQTSNKAQYFAKYARKLLKGVNTRNLFHHLKQKLTVEYNQAMKVREEEILAAGKGRI